LQQQQQQQQQKQQKQKQEQEFSVLAILRCVFILVMNVHLYHRRYEEDQFE
jgi:hypothetical protein